jgi:hypothetical protein
MKPAINGKKLASEKPTKVLAMSDHCSFAAGCIGKSISVATAESVVLLCCIALRAGKLLALRGACILGTRGGRLGSGN